MTALATWPAFLNTVFARLIIEPDTGCLLWAAHKSPPGGYGVVRMPRGSYALVHRLMYETFTGPIPEGMQIDHLCRVRHCASPLHLEAVTPRENTLRGRTLAAANAAKTHCASNHEYDLLNTYFHGGKRYCRACHRDKAQRDRDSRRQQTGVPA